MLAIIKYWPVALSALISFYFGYNVGHYFGVKSGVKIEAGNTAKKQNVTKDKRNEILNNRTSDTNAFLDGLLNDPNW
jgi:hypothetical protein